MSKDVQFQNRDRFIEPGLIISALRKMRGMPQEDLACKAKMSRSHLSSIEVPDIVRPFSVEVLYNIADALGVRAGDLLNNSIFSDKNKTLPYKEASFLSVIFSNPSDLFEKGYN